MDWRALNDIMTWAGWAGVSGIIALLALFAAMIALVEFVMENRLQRLASAATTVRRHLAIVDDMRSLTVWARPMGPTVMYEPEWIGYGVSVGSPETVPVLTARDEPLELNVKLHKDAPLDEAWVGLQWVEVTRTGIRGRAFRTTLKGGRYQRWQSRRTRLGRRLLGAGRWVEGRGKQPLGPPRDLQ